MENVPPVPMKSNNLPTLDALLGSKRNNVKASRQKRSTAALHNKANAGDVDEDSHNESGLLTPPSSHTQEEADMDASKMLFSPPPEEELRHVRNSGSRARSVPIPPFTPSLLADPPTASSKRKRNAHNRSSSHTAFDSVINSVSTSNISITEATPNPKPRKQTKHGSPSRPLAEGMDEPTTPTRSSRRSESPSKRVLFLSPHHTNPNADYFPPLPTISRQSLSTRRRSATPIPPYEPPRERFTPPREIIHTPPGAAHSPDRISKSSKRKSTTKNTKKLVLTIKKEPPEIDLSQPPPPPSPSDDPLLLKGLPVQPRKQKTKPELVLSVSSTPTHARQTPSIASSSPLSPPDPVRGGRIADLNSSMDISMRDDSTDDGFEDGPPMFDFTRPEDSGVWDDSGSESGDEFEQTGEYTGRFTMLTVPTKADPPSSCTRMRQSLWGNPASPYPGGRRRSLPSASSPPLKALSDEHVSPSESPDEEDVFFLDNPIDAEERNQPEFEEGSSRQTLDAVSSTDHSADSQFTVQEQIPERSPSPLPIVEVSELSQCTSHHVRFTAPGDSEENTSMDIDKAENDNSAPIQDDVGSQSQDDAVMSDPEQDPPADDHYDSDSSDEQTVDRELSREPDHEDESDEEDRDTRPAPPLLATPARASTPGRSISPQAGSSRPRGFLSITSPLRRQKPPLHSQQERDIPMPSIESVVARPAAEALASVASTEITDNSPESSTSRSRLRTGASEETVVEDEMEEDVTPPEGDVATDIEDGSGDESDGLEDDVVKITSGDPRVAARAAAILKMHDYDFIIKDPSRDRRHSSVDSVMRKARRRSLMEGGINKHGTPVRRRRTLGGVIGDKVFIPGSPVTTLPQLLHEAELSVQQRERDLHTPSRNSSFMSDDTSFKLPLPLDRPMFETPGPRYHVHARPIFNASGPRAWEKDDWKLLDACFTDERLAAGSHKRLGEATLAPIEEISLDNVVNRFLEYTGDTPIDECWPGWTRDNLLRRVQALQRKQRAGKGAPPTPSGRLSSVALSEVPDFTPLPSRQSSVQPGFDRRGSASTGRTFVPASLLAPRYSHLLDEAIAVSKGEGTPLSNSRPIEYRSASVPAPDQRSVSLPPQSAASALRAESEAPQSLDADAPMELPPSLATRSIAARMKGFFWSYLPRATKPSGPKKPSAPAHPGLPIPPPEMFQKPRGPISTPVSKPSSKPVPPKELVQLHPAPPPQPSRIPRPTQQKPRRLVDLHPAPPPPEPRPRSSTGVVSDRRSSSGSVKDLVRGFENLEKQQERERIEEAARLRRVRSVGEWAAAAGNRGPSVQARKAMWKP